MIVGTFLMQALIFDALPVVKIGNLLGIVSPDEDIDLSGYARLFGLSTINHQLLRKPCSC